MSQRSTLLRFLVAILCIGAAPAIAQDATAEITLKINASDLEVIAKALDALPFPEAMGTMVRVQAQIDAQPGSQWDKYRSATTVQEIRCPAVTP